MTRWEYLSPHGRGDCRACIDDAVATERRDGPRYVEAIRGAAKVRAWLRNRRAGRLRVEDAHVEFLSRPHADMYERCNGIPQGWIRR